MRQFSIKDLERFSNIKAHTIRTWETRYNIFNPVRTSGNIRTYSLEDVRLLLNISLLLENGLKISQLALLKIDDLEQRTQSLLTDKAREHKIIFRLIISTFASDTESFGLILDSCVASLGIDHSIQNIILPFLEKTQILSYKDTSTEVHLAVTTIRRKLILGIESAKTTVSHPSTALLFLPKGEHYDLVLLYMTYILKTKGLRTIYLGTDISKENLEYILKTKRPDFVYTYLPKKHSLDILSLSQYLENELQDAKLFVAEAIANEKLLPSMSNVRFFHYINTNNTVQQATPTTANDIS